MPEELIAQEPLEDRSSSKLLWVHDGQVSHHNFRDILQILRPDDVLVLNDTRVTALRLHGERQSGGKVEALLLRQETENRYVTMVKPAKRLKIGSRIRFGESLEALVVDDLGEGHKVLEFHGDDVAAQIRRAGKVPLPPYISRPLDNPERYQTVYASHGGSAAAPTAGLHFTDELLQELQGAGVRIAKVTLDVGIDTFRPILVNNLDEHKMHGETCTISAETAEAVNNAKGRIIAVGTTVVRTLESMADGFKHVRSGSTNTDIFIRPGFEFRIVDGMFTNFHLPGTTMMVMLSALIGREKLLHAYKIAVENQYRFLSFGDSMLIL